VLGQEGGKAGGAGVGAWAPVPPGQEAGQTEDQAVRRCWR